MTPLANHKGPELSGTKSKCEVSLPWASRHFAVLRNQIVIDDENSIIACECTIEPFQILRSSRVKWGLIAFT